MKSNPDYIRQLESLPPKLRKAWLEGRWDVFEGAYFEEFRTEPDIQMCHDAGISIQDAKEDGLFVHVIEPFEPPHEWKIYRCITGGGKPFSCAWWAVDYDGCAYRILELYGCAETPNEGLHWSNKKQFDEIARMEREHPVWQLMDTLFLGKDAYGILGSDGEGMEMIVKQRGKIGGPLEQFSTIDYKFCHGAKILYQERLLRVESGSSYGSIDEEN